MLGWFHTASWDDLLPPHEMIPYHLMRWFHTTSWDDLLPPHEMIPYHLMRWFHTTSWDDSIPPHEMVPHSYPLGVLVGRYWSQPIKLQWCWASYKLYSFKKKGSLSPPGWKILNGGDSKQWCRYFGRARWQCIDSNLPTEPVSYHYNNYLLTNNS